MQTNRPKHPHPERGAALIVTLFVLVALALIATVSVQMSETEMDIAGNMTKKTQALLAAEAGMARVDAVMTANPDMVSRDSLSYIINSDAALPHATFSVSMDTTMPLRRVIAVGRSEPGGVAAVQVTYRRRSNPLNIWNNAVFAGHGQDSRTIRGNVGIHGSVHILGDGEPYIDVNGNGVWDAGESYTDANHDGTYDGPMTADSIALDMTGGASLYNNYTGMNAVISSRIPPITTTYYGGETVQSLDAELRVKNGNVLLDGTANVGSPDVAGGSPPMKETFDGVYVTDGFTGSGGADAVYTDASSSYDLPDGKLEMPNLDEPYTDAGGTNHATYMDYLRSDALVITGDLVIEQGRLLPLMSGPGGSISMDAFGNLVATGKVYVEGNIIIKGARPIQYDGRFSLVSEGNVTIDADLLSKGTFATDDVMGIIARGSMHLGGDKAQLDLTGAFFSQEEVIMSKQTQLAGTIVSNFFGTKQVPDIYQVPELVNNLPPGMPGGENIYVHVWMRVPKSWVELD